MIDLTHLPSHVRALVNVPYELSHAVGGRWTTKIAYLRYAIQKIDERFEWHARYCLSYNEGEISHVEWAARHGRCCKGDPEYHHTQMDRLNALRAVYVKALDKRSHCHECGHSLTEHAEGACSACECPGWKDYPLRKADEV
jgi:hypothetical protein